MDMESIVNRYILTDMAILERVDEYTLYCKYLGFQPELRTKYKSSIRAENSDEAPSFSIFTSNKPDREYFWKDNGGKGIAGDIFKLIMLLHGYKTIREAFLKVDVDFKLGFGSAEPPKGKIIEYFPPQDIPAHISIKAKPYDERFLNYWKQFGVDTKQLEKFRTHNVGLYWLSKQQVCATTPRYGICNGYEIMGRYQLYQPFAPKDKKFRQNLTDRDLHGFHQLQYRSDKLWITKARKDTICIDAHGFDVIACRSENTPIAPEYLRFLESKYPGGIYTLMDNDGKHRAEDFYPGYQHREIPKSSGFKDPAEFRSGTNPKEFIQLLTQLQQ